jgi:hypothetical protein
MAETFELRIWPDGRAMIVWDGIEGSDCMDLAKGFEEAMGADMSTVEYLPEFYRKPRERSVILREGNGS